MSIVVTLYTAANSGLQVESSDLRSMNMNRLQMQGKRAFITGLFCLAGCSILPKPHAAASPRTREFSTTVQLHGKPLDLHVIAPGAPAADPDP